MIVVVVVVVRVVMMVVVVVSSSIVRPSVRRGNSPDPAVSVPSHRPRRLRVPKKGK